MSLIIYIPWCFGNNHLELCSVKLYRIRVRGNTDSPSAVVLHRDMFQFYSVSVVLLCYIAWVKMSSGQAVLQAQYQTLGPFHAPVLRSAVRGSSREGKPLRLTDL